MILTIDTEKITKELKEALSTVTTATKSGLKKATNAVAPHAEQVSELVETDSKDKYETLHYAVQRDTSSFSMILKRLDCLENRVANLEQEILSTTHSIGALATSFGKRLENIEKAIRNDGTILKNCIKTEKGDWVNEFTGEVVKEHN
jgi:septation ring formation regulator EzrA